MRRQAGNVLCDASAKLGNRRACGATPCELAARQLRLGFTPWGACEAACGAGFNARSAVCADADGAVADVTACSGYSGAALTCVMHN